MSQRRRSAEGCPPREAALPQQLPQPVRLHSLQPRLLRFGSLRLSGLELRSQWVLQSKGCGTVFLIEADKTDPQEITLRVRLVMDKSQTDNFFSFHIQAESGCRLLPEIPSL